MKVKELLKVAQEHPESQEILDELIHDIKSKEAADINNKGVEDQVVYIVSSGCAAELEGALKDG